jgi:hypothetical protein
VAVRRVRAGRQAPRGRRYRGSVRQKFVPG